VSGRRELGCAGHFILSRQARWHRHTQVGNYRVSTVGAIFLDGEDGMYDFGGGKRYESMVFVTTDEPNPGSEGCGCKKVVDWCGVDTVRYEDAAAADAGHERLVEWCESRMLPPTAAGDES
jgi:hypothetical protein